MRPLGNRHLRLQPLHLIPMLEYLIPCRNTSSLAQNAASRIRAASTFKTSVAAAIFSNQCYTAFIALVALLRWCNVFVYALSLRTRHERRKRKDRLVEVGFFVCKPMYIIFWGLSCFLGLARLVLYFNFSESWTYCKTHDLSQDFIVKTGRFNYYFQSS